MLKSYEKPFLTKAGSVEAKTEAVSNVTGAMSVTVDLEQLDATKTTVLAFS